MKMFELYNFLTESQTQSRTMSEWFSPFLHALYPDTFLRFLSCSSEIPRLSVTEFWKVPLRNKTSFSSTPFLCITTLTASDHLSLSRSTDVCTGACFRYYCKVLASLFFFFSPLPTPAVKQTPNRVLYECFIFSNKCLSYLFF